MKIEVGQVFKVDGELVMVASKPVPLSQKIMAGKAERRGTSYAITGSPVPMNANKFREDIFIFDTEAGR